MLKKLLFAAVITCFIPFLLAGLILSYKTPEEPQQEEQLQSEPVEDKAERTVSVLTENGLKEMLLEDYIFCVVLAEMPADFELEALKAQAVVARTYTCRKMESSKHSEGDVCTDFQCCQAFIWEEDYISSGGTEKSVQKVRQAVSETAGKVLTYNSELIEATYFSCSGGKTEDAKEVWGGEVPYLQSVESPGEEQAEHYMDTVTFSAAEFCQKLGLSLSGFPASWIGQITYTKGGGVSTIQIGGENFSGTEIRELLQLRSTAFVITAAGDHISVTTKGFGHRVGMSQYGADAMAVQGSDYECILYHYYQGTCLTDLSG